TDPRSRTWPRLAGRWLATAAHERPGQAPVLLRVYARTGLLSMRRAMDASRRHDVAQAVARTACPLLLVRGRHDRIAPADWVESLAALREGRRVSLPVGAHMVPITHAQHLAALLGPWLRAVTPAA
ncbi:MAG: alpha/beta hydrolase, partial [Actinomycetota bacterium]|nr:alpha/beta hydrolase [Actinomycetota bacterium]